MQDGHPSHIHYCWLLKLNDCKYLAKGRLWDQEIINMAIKAEGEFTYVHLVPGVIWFVLYKSNGVYVLASVRILLSLPKSCMLYYHLCCSALWSLLVLYNYWSLCSLLSSRLVMKIWFIDCTPTTTTKPSNYLGYHIKKKRSSSHWT